MKLFRYLVMKGTFCTLLYLAYSTNLDGAERVILVWVWVLAVASIGYLVADLGLKAEDYVAPQWVDVALGLLFIGTLAWNDAVATSAAYTFYFASAQGHRAGLLEKEEQAR